MKKAFALILSASLVFVSVNSSMAVTGTNSFNVSATMPATTSLSVVAQSISLNSAPSGLARSNATTGTLTTNAAGTILSFDPLTYDAVKKIYAPDHYFQIMANALGTPMDITINYTEGVNPNNVTGASGHGLGWKTTATFSQLSSQGTIVAIPNHPKKKLQNVLGEHILPAEQNSVATVLMYLTIETNPSASGEPSGIETFSHNDKPGSYTGALQITVTIP